MAEQLLPALVFGSTTDNTVYYHAIDTTITTISPLSTANWSSVDTTPCHGMENYYNFRVVINVYLVGPMCVLGFIGNTLSVIVLRVDNVNNTVSFLLQALAFADNAYLITCMCIQTIKTITECTQWIPSLLYTYPYIESYIWPAASIAQTTAVWLVMLVTIDRSVSNQRH